MPDETTPDIRDGIEWFQVPGRDGSWECMCARCGSSCADKRCEECGGLGYIDDADDDFGAQTYACETCGGVGGWRFCLSSREWCEANPMPGRELVQSTAREAAHG